MLDCLVDDGTERGEERRLLRIVEGVRGDVPVRILVAPRFDYGAVRPWIRRHGGRWSAIGGDDGLLVTCDAPLEPDGRHALRARATVRAGERLRLALTYRRPADLEADDTAPGAEALDTALAATIERWRDWSDRDGAPGSDGAHRSALALKALTYEPTGAMVAAATTSLPEGHRGERAWDYRYSWIRDSVMASRSLTQLGYDAEADAFRRFIERSAAGSAEDLQVFYGVGGERRAPEETLGGLRGYDGAEVSVGNGAATQLQLDAYGHLLGQSWRAHERGHPPDDDYWRFLVDCVDAAARSLERPDNGIWEWRGDGRHFVYSKVMCWLACDRGLRLAEACDRDAPVQRWTDARAAIAKAVDAQGYDPERGTFLQAFGRPTSTRPSCGCRAPASSPTTTRGCSRPPTCSPRRWATAACCAATTATTGCRAARARSWPARSGWSSASRVRAGATRHSGGSTAPRRPPTTSGCSRRSTTSRAHACSATSPRR